MKAIFISRGALAAIALSLAPPLFMIGPYGVTLPEMIVVVCGFGLMLAASGPVPRLPRVLVVYLLLFMVGWLGSLYNAYEWNIPVNASNLAFLYTPMLALLAYVTGRYSSRQLDLILAHWFTKAVLVAVATFAVIYPFLPVSTRITVFSLFLENPDLRRMSSPRFPGMGINANMYAFMVYPFFAFSFNAYLAKRTSALVPLMSAVIIVAAASRTIVGLLGMAAVTLVISAVRHVRARKRARRMIRFPHWAPKSPRRIAVVVAAMLAVGAAGVVYGSRVQAIFTVWGRIEELFGLGDHIGGGGLEGRQEMWAMGMKRVEIAPVLGLPKDMVKGEDETNPLYFYTPHNEFIYFWSAFGIAGLLAHIYLVVRMILLNVRARAELPWVLFYAGLAIQMVFDAVFQGPRVAAFVFLLIGLNFKYLAGLQREQREQREQRAAPSAPPVPLAPSPA